MISFNNYIFQRLIRTFKNKGFSGLIISIFNYLNSKLNPKVVGEFPFKYLFLKKRRLIKNYTDRNLDKLDDKDITPTGNYLIKNSVINSNSIIYSFGVGGSISFEESLSNKFNCVVNCYDPTNVAINFMNNKKYNKDLIKFYEYGIWIVDEKVKFYKQNTSTNLTGGSITNLFENSEFDLLQCYKLSTLMKKNNHNYVDVLKMDIEGAAMEVLNNILQEKIFPGQIIVEFEYSETDKINEQEFKQWSKELSNIVNKFKHNGYKCYNLPRYSHFPYSTIEILFVKNQF